MKGMRAIGIIILFITMLVSGCELGKETEEPKASVPPGVSHVTGKLKVLAWNESFFDVEHGRMIKSKFPNIEIEVVKKRHLDESSEDYEQKLDELIRKERPDLIFLNDFNYKDFVKRGLLYDLTPLIQRDRFELDRMHPAVVDYLRVDDKGIYALGPKFVSYALFYNKDLFDQYGVPYPKDGMSWEQLFLTASRFAGEGDEDTRVYGFGIPFSLADFEYYTYILSLYYELEQIDSTGRKLTMNTNGWHTVYNLVIQAFHSGALKVYDSPTYVETPNLFSEGLIAMTESSTDEIEQLKDADFEWGIVQLPAANPQKPVSPTFYAFPLYSISSQAENLETAWEVVRYFNGIDYAKIRQAVEPGSLSVYPEIADENFDVDMDVFYNVHPTEPAYSHEPYVDDFKYNTLNPLIKEELKRMASGEVTVKQGLERIQSEGQKLLDEAWRAMDGG